MFEQELQDSIEEYWGDAAAAYARLIDTILSSEKKAPSNE